METMRRAGGAALVVTLLLSAAGCSHGDDGEVVGGATEPPPPSEVVPALVSTARTHVANWSPEDPFLPSGTAVDRSGAYPVGSVEVPPPGGTTVVVHLTGARGPSTERCGADYTGEAVSGPAAAAIIVVQRSSSQGGACAAIGHARSVEVALPEPFDGRAFVTWDGIPLSVSQPQPASPPEQHGDPSTDGPSDTAG